MVKGSDKVILGLHDCIIAGVQTAVFKVVVETAVVHVDGAAGGDHVVRDTHLGVAETGRKLKDPYAAPRKSVVIGTCQAVDHLFVRDSGSDDPDIHAAHGGKTQSVVHLIRDDQIGSDIPHIILGSFRDAHVHIFSHGDAVHRGIRVGLDKAFRPLNRGRNKVLGKIPVVFIVFTDGIPHLQEDGCQTLYGISFEADACILPETVGFCPVKIFVCKIISAGEADFAVDHGDLAVIAVIEEEIQTRNERVENTALQAVGPGPFDKVHVDKAKAAHVIVKNTHIHAGFGALLKNLQHLMPGFRVLNGMVLHENKALRLCEFFLLGFKPLQSVIVISDLGILINRITGIFPDVMDDTPEPAVLRFHTMFRHFVVRQHGKQDLIDLHIASSHFQGVSVQTDQKIQDRSHNGHKHDQHDPGHTYGCCLVTAIDDKDQ